MHGVALLPVQVIVIPVAQHKEGVLEANEAVVERLSKAGFRVKMDASSLGRSRWEWMMLA